jgi:hypothetical protein
MDLEKFLLEADIHNSDKCMSFEEAMIFKTEHNIPNLSYTVIKKIINISFLESDNEGKYFFKYVPDHSESDIMYDFESNFEIKICVDNHILKTENLKLLSCCVLYQKISFRIYVDTDEICVVKFRSVLLSSEARHRLRSSEVIFKDNVYFCGTLMRGEQAR